MKEIVNFHFGQAGVQLGILSLWNPTMPEKIQDDESFKTFFLKNEDKIHPSLHLYSS